MKRRESVMISPEGEELEEITNATEEELTKFKKEQPETLRASSFCDGS